MFYRQRLHLPHFGLFCHLGWWAIARMKYIMAAAVVPISVSKRAPITCVPSSSSSPQSCLFSKKNSIPNTLAPFHYSSSVGHPRATAETRTTPLRAIFLSSCSNGEIDFGTYITAGNVYTSSRRRISLNGLHNLHSTAKVVQFSPFDGFAKANTEDESRRIVSQATLRSLLVSGWDNVKGR